MNSKPLHKYSDYFSKINFFKNLNSFRDLEEKIKNLEKIKGLTKELTDGYAFEVFVECYLNTINDSKFSKIYPQGYVPSNILKQLNLPRTDRGYDGVYEDNLGKFHTYQCKFKTHREKLNWDKLSTFAGIGENLKSRHLFCNSNKIVDDFLNKSDAIATRGYDFEKLEANNFDAIHKFLKKNKEKKFKGYNLDPYQKDTREKIIKELELNNRTSIILACGLGKTLIGLSVFEKIKPKLTVVYVPSIALVKQTRDEWIFKSKYKINTIVVSSIKDVDYGKDPNLIKKNELDFKPTTDPKIIKKWYKTQSKNLNVIFCTYQSSKKLSKALKNIKVNFGIFDEAHRTAIVNKKQNKESSFSHSLNNKNIFIEKRLFMTATKRISRKNKFLKEGDKIQALTMENTEIYGKVCKSISFLEGAKLGVIAKPRVLISVVTSDELDREKLSHSITAVKGKEIRTPQVASQIAIRNMMQKEKINKIFSFHNSIPKSVSFTSDGPEGIGSHIKNIDSAHIDGSMSVKDRSEIIQDFKLSKKGIVSNVRCLVEGVDVPTVDAVAFTHPKESLIDIIQAIGRSLRKRGMPKKKFGHVILPLFVKTKKNEKISDALERTNFDNIADTINALREHDDEIEQIVQKAIIYDKNIGGSRGGGWDIEDDFISIEHPIISKKILNKAIKFKLYEKLITKWEENLKLLIKYKNKFKDFKSRYEIKIYHDLFQWMDQIRRRNIYGTLPSFNVKQLNDINFDWRLEYDEIGLDDIHNYISFNKFSEYYTPGLGFSARGSGTDIKYTNRYLLNFCKTYDLKIYKSYETIIKKRYNKTEKFLRIASFIHKKSFEEVLSKNKIIFFNEFEKINKNKKCLFLKSKIINNYKSKSLPRSIEVKLEDGTIKNRYLLFGSQISNMGKKTGKKKLTGLVYHKDDLDIFFKEIEKIPLIDKSKELLTEDFNEKYGFSILPYERQNKIKKYERRLGFLKRYVYLQKDIDIFLKNVLKISLTSKDLKDKNLVIKSIFVKKLSKILGSNIATTDTILSNYEEKKIITSLGNGIKRIKINQKHQYIHKFYHLDELNNLRANLIKWYSKSLPSYDKNKELILNYSRQNLKKLGLFRDNDLAVFFKIKHGSPLQNKKIVRSLRRNWGLNSYCYSRQEGNPSICTKISDAKKFKDKFGSYLNNTKGYISHIVLQRISFFRNSFALDLINNKKLKCYGFKSAKGSINFFLKTKEVINFINKERQSIKFDKYDKDNSKIIKKISNMSL